MSGLSVRKKMRNMLFVFCGILLIIISWIVYQNINLGSKYKEAAAKQQTKDIEVGAKRGTVYDRNGKQLAVSVSADTVILDLSNSLQLSESEIKKLFKNS